MTLGPGSKKRTAGSKAADGSAGLDHADGASDGVQAPASRDGQSPPQPATTSPGGYTVVARRYRPQRFEDVVGQDHVVQALRNAIRLNRLAQAYLFCGTRGVGKTSMARIFAKCLNCVKGPTESPCQVCDICQAIASGQDVDVIEIDGASNNGVEQVRELRQNASLRPSRSRFKIYYIDEVHMLSTGAFNALLKTLEEPPPHVKFFFATTEANKIPITVLSRCQRYDFAGITPEAIVTTLAEICARERVEAEAEALQVVARRAGGSMRDAQSLLEQLLASGSPKLTVEVVHGLLGTASDERLLDTLEALANHDTAAALMLLDRAANEGVQPADMLTGVLEFLRDAMVLSVGAGSVLLAVTPRQRPRLQAVVDRWPIDSILAALQILAEARGRMRGVAHSRLLAELALARVARLEDLTELSNLVERLSALETGQGVKKKLTGPETTAPRPEFPRERPAVAGPVQETVPAARAGRESQVQAKPAGPEPARPQAKALDGRRAGPGPSIPTRGVATGAGSTSVQGNPQSKGAGTADHKGGGAIDAPGPLELSEIRQVWPDLIKKVGSPLNWRLPLVEPIAIEGPDLLVIAARPGYNSHADPFGSNEAREKVEQGLQWLLRRPVRVRYQPSTESQREEPSQAAERRRPEVLTSDPMVQKVVELFEARPMHLEYEDDADRARPSGSTS